MNGNGTRESNGADTIAGNSDDEIPLSGWTIRAYTDTNASGTLQAGETTSVSTTTAADGTYGFSLSPGSYVLCERIDDQTGYGQSAPANNNCAAIAGTEGVAPGGHPVLVTPTSSSPNQNFANYQVSTVTGMKWEDEDADGVKEAGDLGLSGWVIYVDYNDNGTKDAGEPFATTGAGGTYTITGIKPGSFKVREVPQTGWQCSAPIPCFYTETFTSGSAKTGKDFGNYQQGTVTGLKFADDNANGI